jgi:hypothetical protein
MSLSQLSKILYQASKEGKTHIFRKSVPNVAKSIHGNFYDEDEKATDWRIHPIADSRYPNMNEDYRKQESVELLLVNALRDILLSCRKYAPTVDRSRGESLLRMLGKPLPDTNMNDRPTDIRDIQTEDNMKSSLDLLKEYRKIVSESKIDISSKEFDNKEEAETAKDKYYDNWPKDGYSTSISVKQKPSGKWYYTGHRWDSCD